MKKISILVVAPYPEFGELAVDIAKAYPQINVYVAPGIYQNAIEYILKIIDRKAISISLWEVAAISGASTAAIGLLNAFSTVAGKAITMSGVSNFLSNLITSNINSRAVFLLMINILFLFLGMFLDINAAVLIMTPLLLPVAKTYGITAFHFGAILLVNMSVGFMTPPFALGTFVGTKITGAGYGETVKESIPFMIVGLVAIIITTCFPEYVMFFVNILS